MSERWIPVLAAVVGVLGGMGGALVGGSLANQGQEQRFYDEQRVRMLDLKRETYAKYLLAAAKVNQGAEGDKAEEERRSEEVDAAEANVQIYANTEVRNKATALLVAVKDQRAEEDKKPEETYPAARLAFIEAAKGELRTGE